MTRKLSSALKTRCPYGVAECCVGENCMAWRGSQLEYLVEQKRVDTGKDEAAPEGADWRLIRGYGTVEIWGRGVPGGDCRRLENENSK